MGYGCRSGGGGEGKGVVGVEVARMGRCVCPKGGREGGGGGGGVGIRTRAIGAVHLSESKRIRDLILWR